MANPFPVPLNALRAIEIVARRGALSPAADELGVTVGAVSQHIRRAEERLGVTLFQRTPQGLVATAALEAVRPQLSAGFRGLAEALASLKPADDHCLTLTVGSVFASRFLVSRLGRFTTGHPEIEFRMVATGKLVDLDRPDIDCGIRFGGGQWPGTKAELLGGQLVLPVCAPGLLAQLKQPADLTGVPVITDESSMLSWTEWFNAAGLAELPTTAGPIYSDPSLAFDAAIGGQGVLLVVEMMAADALRDGRLAAPFVNRLKTELGYWFVVAEDRRTPKKVKLFRDWLAAEIAALEA